LPKQRLRVVSFEGANPSAQANVRNRISGRDGAIVWRGQCCMERVGVRCGPLGLRGV